MGYRGRPLLRYGMFLVGVFLIALGVAASVRSQLGTSPIATPSFVLGEGDFFSIGTATMTINSLCVLLQWPVLGRRFGVYQLLQIPVGLAFGALVDLAMWLTPWFQPQNYLLQWVGVLAGCVLIAVGVVVQLLPKVVAVPPDALVAALAQRTGILVGNLKVFFDVTLVGLGAVISLVMFGQIVGIREGTLASMVLIGVLVGRIMPPLNHRFAAFMEAGQE